MVYSEKVMDHFQNPRNMGEIEDADGVGDVGNPVCGDLMRLTIKVDAEAQTIADIKFKTFGCGAAIATSSMITELVKGKTLEEAAQVTNRDVANELDGLPSPKMHCSLLAEQGIAAALANYYENHPELTPVEGLMEKVAKLSKVDPHEHEGDEDDD